MEIYIEYVIIDNLIINFLILYISCKLLKQKVFFWKIVLSSCIGTACALVLPLMTLPVYLLIIFKFMLGLIMVLVSLPCQNIKRALSSFLVFLIVTGAMGGICFMLIFMISGSVSVDILIEYTSDVPVGVVLLICSLTALTLSKLIKYIHRKKVFHNFVFETILSHEGKNIKINAFLDSGNTLIDPITNKPVVIVNYSLFNKLYNLPLEKLISKNIEEEIKSFHYITFNTVGSKSEMLVFEIEKMEISLSKEEIKQFENVALGLSFSKLNKTFECDALLHPMLMCN